ncbi:hypothetical protein KA005_29485 [bacterium]|nr:hypothetical protein [bacterium]
MDLGKFISSLFGGDGDKKTSSAQLLVESNYRLTNMNYQYFEVYQKQIDQLIENQKQLIKENKQIKEFLKEKYPDD